MANPTSGADRGNQKFISTLMQTPLLEREHEYELARRWREERDEEALSELIVAHGRLVVRIAWKFRASGLPIDDLIQEGNTGLLDAAERFDTEREVRFSTYASWWIVAAIQNYILRNSSMVRVATTPAQRRLFFNLRRARAKLDATRDGFNDDDRERLAEELDVTVEDVRRMEVHLSRPDTSLNARVGEDEGAEVQDFLASDAPSPEVAAMDDDVNQKRKAWIATALKDLNPRERKIIEKRFLGQRRLTLAEIGEEFGVSKERVRQLESRALTKMGHLLNGIVDDPKDLPGYSHH